jgi:murein DD-endopeptidase MepM/ murein hydrolase activator NlpD
VIDDGNGYRSIYAHFSKIVVARGDLVDAGTFLGWEGMSGHASGCHLHYGLFSPEETATLTFDPKLAAKMLLPDREILRVDPERVLPRAPSPAS